MKNIFYKSFVLFSILSILTSCSHKIRSEEKLLKLAFHAIQQNSWNDYQRLTITLAEVTDGDPKLKAQQLEVQKEDFQHAIQGGQGQIDFKTATYVGPGTLLAPVTLNETTTFKGNVYSIKLKNQPTSPGTSAIVDTQSLYPQFLVVQTNGEYRLLALVFVGD